MRQMANPVTESGAPGAYTRKPLEEQRDTASGHDRQWPYPRLQHGSSG